MTDKQIISITIDDLISGNLQDMEFTAQFAVYRQAVKGLAEQLKAKEQECEELKKELHKNFEEKDTLHLIIDRLLEASGYNTNTASAEDFEDVYENMRYEKQQLDQLKAENEKLKKERKILDDETIVVEITEKQFEEYQKLKQALTEIKQLLEDALDTDKTDAEQSFDNFYKAIKLCEVLDE